MNKHDREDMENSYVFGGRDDVVVFHKGRFVRWKADCTEEDIQ